LRVRSKLDGGEVLMAGSKDPAVFVLGVS
jgi:hypothetical protein